MNRPMTSKDSDYENIEFELDKDAKIELEEKSDAKSGRNLELVILSVNTNQISASEASRNNMNEVLSNYLQNVISTIQKPNEIKSNLDYIIKLNDPDVILSDEKALENLISLNILLNKKPENRASR